MIAWVFQVVVLVFVALRVAVFGQVAHLAVLDARNAPGQISVVSVVVGTGSAQQVIRVDKKIVVGLIAPHAQITSVASEAVVYAVVAIVVQHVKPFKAFCTDGGRGTHFALRAAGEAGGARYVETVVCVAVYTRNKRRVL